jgi:hypothetical protein
VVNVHLNVDASPKWLLHLCYLPMAIAFAEHNLQAPSNEICKSGIWAIIRNTEAKQITPE